MVVAKVRLPNDPDIKAITPDKDTSPRADPEAFTPSCGSDVLREILGTNRSRPKSASYVPRQCREHRPGAGGSPLPTALKRRPASARAGGKTERWREGGEVRWPPPPTHEYKRGPPQEVVPFHQTIENCQNKWHNELWMRSLRKVGVIIQDPVYATPGADVQQLHEEWRGCPLVSARTVAYSGATVSGRAAMEREINPSNWVERPVATGKYALTHFDGQRYKFNGQPRFYEEQGKEVRNPPTSRRRARRSAPPANTYQWHRRLCLP